MKTLRKLMLKLLPKDIKQEIKEGYMKDLEHLHHLGLVEVSELGIQITSKGRASIIQSQHLDNLK